MNQPTTQNRHEKISMGFDAATWNREFHERIRKMNEMYKLPISNRPTFAGLGEPVDVRLKKFRDTLMDEVKEIDDLIDAAQDPATDSLDLLTGLADLLGDIIVYCRSEALKYGIPLESVLDIIMDSNESKLDADGKPIYDANGKFLKGPNYWKPEEKISDLLYIKGAITTSHRVKS